MRISHTAIFATLVALTAVLAITAPGVAAGADSIPVERQVFGTSANSRDMVVVRRGFGAATIDVLVVAVIHGNEDAGIAVTRRLRRWRPPSGVRLWLVTTANPDGLRRGTRQNARGVDLNRNFPARWRGGGRPWDTYYPGRAAASEPETRAMQALVRRVQPDVTIWYHQHLDMVVRPEGSWPRRVARRYATVSGLRLRDLAGPRLRGTATGWQRAAQPAGAAFVVELPAGSLGARAARRHVAAVFAAARLARLTRS